MKVLYMFLGFVLCLIMLAGTVGAKGFRTKAQQAEYAEKHTAITLKKLHKQVQKNTAKIKQLKMERAKYQLIDDVTTDTGILDTITIDTDTQTNVTTEAK